MLPWKRAFGPLAALLLAVSVATTAPAVAATPTAPAVTAAAASSGWNNYSCKPSATHPRPVVLVHGTFGNSVDNWLGLAPYLVNADTASSPSTTGSSPECRSSTASAPSTSRPSN